MEKCPYNDIVLLTASISAQKKMTEMSNLDEMLDKLNNVSKAVDKATMNVEIAKNNGISLETLINSPNYSFLVAEHEKFLFLKGFEIFKEYGFSEKECWALIAVSLGKFQ